MRRGHGRGRGRGGGHGANCQSPSLPSSHGSKCEELKSSQSNPIGGGGQNPEQPGIGGQLQHLLEEILGRLGPRSEVG